MSHRTGHSVAVDVAVGTLQHVLSLVSGEGLQSCAICHLVLLQQVAALCPLGLWSLVTLWPPGAPLGSQSPTAPEPPAGASPHCTWRAVLCKYPCCLESSRQASSMSLAPFYREASARSSALHVCPTSSCCTFSASQKRNSILM